MSCWDNIVTENKELPDNAKIDMIVSLITLKYTQSNSVCYVKDGQAESVSAQVSSPVYIVPVWQVRKPTTGICANLRRC